MKADTKAKKKSDHEQFQEALNTWLSDHIPFVTWWKEHRHSGFCYSYDQEGRELWQWNIHPMSAWQISRYRVEYADTLGKEIASTKEFSDYVRLQWKKDQEKAERLSKKFGTTYNAAHNKKLFEKHCGSLAQLAASLVSKMTKEAHEAASDQNELTESEKYAQINAANKQPDDDNIPF